MSGCVCAPPVLKRGEGKKGREGENEWDGGRRRRLWDVLSPLVHTYFTGEPKTPLELVKPTVVTPVRFDQRE